MKRFLRIIVLLIVVVNSIFAAAQNPDTAKRWRWIAEPQFNYALPFVGSLAAVKVDTLWGFIDTTGKLVIEPRFDDIGSMFGQTDRKRRSGHLRFEKSQMYVMLGIDQNDWSNLMWAESKYLTPVSKDKKIGFIDTNGRVVHEPRFRLVYDLRDLDIVVAEEFSDSPKNCLLDMEGRILTEHINGDIDVIDRSFISMECNGKFGVVTSKGKIIAQPIYDEIIPYDDSQVMARLDDKLVYIDVNGRVSDSATQNDLPKRIEIVERKGRFGLVGADGEIVVKPSYSKIWQLGRRGSAFVTFRGGLFGIIDPAGVVVSEPEYTKIEEDEYSDYLVVMKNSQKGLVHPIKRVVFPPVLDDWNYLKRDTILVGRRGKNIVSVDLNGKFTITRRVQSDSNELDDSDLDSDFKKLDESDFVDGYAIIEDRVVDERGNVIVELNGDRMYHSGGGRFVVQRDIWEKHEYNSSGYSLFGYLEIIK